jgi:hypothetical protein|eukprot:COSAG06_NODE_80_length_25388_cov_33.371545_22_plen_102_part_00
MAVRSRPRKFWMLWGPRWRARTSSARGSATVSAPPASLDFHAAEFCMHLKIDSAQMHMAAFPGGRGHRLGARRHKGWARADKGWAHTSKDTLNTINKPGAW